MVRLFKVFVPASTLVLLVSETLLITACYAAPGYLFYSRADIGRFYNAESGAIRLAVVVLFTLIGFYFNNLYTELRVTNRFRLLQQICLVLGLSFLAQALLEYIHPKWILPKWMMIVGSALVLLLVFAWRMFFSAAGRTAFGFQRFLFLGTSPTLFQVADHLASHPELGLAPLGYLDEGFPDKGYLDEDCSSPLPRLGSIHDIDEVVRSVRPNRVAVGVRDTHAVATEKLLDLRFAGVLVEDVQHLYEVTFGKVCLSEIPLWNIMFSSGLQPERRDFRKRIHYSVVVALAMLVFLSPLLLLLALAVKLSSGGPVIRREKRTGFHLQPFDLLQFEVTDTSTGRLTAIGRWLRQMHLENLPGLWNVVRGEMSLVGPRSERPEFTEALRERIPFYVQRHSVLPGLTGWAALNDPAGADSASPRNAIAALEYDLYYVKNASFSLDLYILLHRFKRIARTSELS